MQTIYRPGQWNLIVIPGALVALPPDAPADVVATLWERLPAEKTLATVVDVLTTRAGGSFTALPPFAAAVAEGADVRIALRGGVAARVSTAADGAQELSGAEVTTWSERFVGGATRIEITVEATEGDAALPVQSGIVRAAAVSAELELSDADPLAAALGPVPVVEPASADVSSAVLSGGPVPSLARFGGGTTDAGAGGAGVGVVPPVLAVVPTPGVPVGSAGVPGADAASSSPAEPPALVAQDPAAAAEAAQEPVPEGAGSAEPVAEQPVEEEPVADGAAAGEAAADDPDAAGVQPDAPAAELAAVDAESPTEQIAEVPEPGDDSTPAATDVPASTEAPQVVDGNTLYPTEVTLGPADDDFDLLFGETVHSVSGVTAPPPAPPIGEGDHDGATISAAELRALRQQPSAADETPTAVLPVSEAPTPSVGRLRVSTGQVVTLDRTVIIGRRPRSTRASGANLPHLIAVESPQQDISRSHLEVRPEGDTVVVIDLHTTNGSTLLRPGADPVRLHPGEQTLVLTGDVVDLGDGVTVAFEDLP
ncbi:FHA domain-containing protein [Microbacterium sp. 179-I 3D4 NHS]|uniref:FHA domain-containing protein n=1 Tax=Microbacterium sp. 179-I 3D4 NHS TaxID=3142381 RepID=UPI0039A1392C